MSVLQIASKVFLHGQYVCQRLAGVVQLVAAIDDGNPACTDDLLQVAVPIETGHDATDITRQVGGLMLDTRENEIRGGPVDINGVAAQFSHRNLKRHASASAGLLEQHGHGLTMQQLIESGWIRLYFCCFG